MQVCFICREVEGGRRAVGALGSQHEVTLEEREGAAGGEGVEPEWAGLGRWPLPGLCRAGMHLSGLWDSPPWYFPASEPGTSAGDSAVSGWQPHCLAALPLSPLSLTSLPCKMGAARLS